MASSPNSEAPLVEALLSAIETDTTEENDSSYADSLISSTQSLSPSIRKHITENGRRYHAYKDGQYWAPNDEIQLDAEDISHAMYREILVGYLYLAPITDYPQHVLDVGCGTGIWAMDFADAHPSAEVVGIDLSPVQPGFVPPNCRFVVDDINDAWLDPDDKFDFVHIRGMTGSVPDWEKFQTTVLQHLKPGGFVEQVELSGQAMSDDGTLAQDSHLVKWWKLFKEIGDKTGKTFAASEVAYESITAAGFINVEIYEVKVPIGIWAKDDTFKLWGALNREFLLRGLEGFALRGLTKVLNWSMEEAQVYLAGVRKELKDPKIHSYLYLRIVYGQKPF